MIVVLWFLMVFCVIIFGFAFMAVVFRHWAKEKKAAREAAQNSAPGPISS